VWRTIQSHTNHTWFSTVVVIIVDLKENLLSYCRNYGRNVETQLVKDQKTGISETYIKT